MSYWLSENLPVGSWVIDPFGASPQMAVEAARAGYKVLVICNNPILQFYTEILSAAPTRSDFHAALADFAREKHGAIRLETHLQSLYQTNCPTCGREIPVRSFTWKKGQDQPISKVILCEFCKTEGEFPIDSADMDRLNGSGAAVLHRARAIQRVNITPEVEKAAEEVSQAYLARSLNFLFSMINRIERVDSSAYHQKLLYALLIHLLDAGNTMWPWPTARARPKVLSTPAQFREQNLWLALESGIDLWSSDNAPIPFTIWPEIPMADHGICLYKGRISAFKNEASQHPLVFASACTVFPRPNQAFWSLSAVWSGWLWGRNSVLPMKAALERRRFDWYWYSVAVHQTLTNLFEMLPETIPFWGSISEAEIGFLSSTIFAAENAGFNLRSCALRVDEEIAQLLWEKELQERKSPARGFTEECIGSIQRFLLAKNEPADDLEATTACLVDVAQKKMIPISKETLPYHSIKNLQQEIASLLNESTHFSRHALPVGAQERTLYWVGKNIPTQASLADRVELAIIQMLGKNNVISYIEMDRALCKAFPGLLTPASNLIRTILHSYAEMDQDQHDVYRLKEHATQQVLENEQARIKVTLRSIGNMLNYSAQPGSAVIWQNKSDLEPVAIFHIISSAVFSHAIFSQAVSEFETRPRIHAVVYPDVLTPLVEYKLNSNPLLKESLGKQIKLISHQRIQNLAEKKMLNLGDFLLNLEKSLPDEGPSQIPIFTS